MYKKGVLLICQSKPFAFLPFSLSSVCSLLKLPTEFYKQGKLLKLQKKYKNSGWKNILFKKDRRKLACKRDHHFIFFQRKGTNKRPSLILRSLSNNDHDGSENITKKMNLRPFKLYRVYLEALNSSNVGDYSWKWIVNGFIFVQIEEGKFVVVCPRPP